MIKKIIAFGASNSSISINKKLATYATSLLKEADVKILDLNDYEMPIYSMDRERSGGIPQLAQDFKSLVDECDAIIISIAEHNGSYSAAFKNILDWTSRLEGKTWSDKLMILLSTSPGARGGITALSSAVERFPFMGAKIVGHFSLPSFNSNFDNDAITNQDLNSSLIELIEKLEEELAV
jgi:chromate reductase, NAD(P)H dehydrogenase (quinone)